MKVTTDLRGSALYLNVKGHITGMNEVENIKSTITLYNNFNTVELLLEDAYVIPSSLLGYLVKLKVKENKSIVINTKEESLEELLISLELHKLFSIKKG